MSGRKCSGEMGVCSSPRGLSRLGGACAEEWAVNEGQAWFRLAERAASGLRFSGPCLIAHTVTALTEHKTKLLKLFSEILSLLAQTLSACSETLSINSDCVSALLSKMSVASTINRSATIRVSP